MKIRRRARHAARIEMLPLIDIVFLLLVFFIYAMLSMAVHRGLQLDLPESGQAEVSKESPLKLFVRSGSSGTPEISVNEQRVSTAELEHYLMTLQDTSKLPRVLLFAEEEISYQQLYLVLDVLKKSGCRDISLQASTE